MEVRVKYTDTARPKPAWRMPLHVCSDPTLVSLLRGIRDKGIAQRGTCVERLEWTLRTSQRELQEAMTLKTKKHHAEKGKLKSRIVRLEEQLGEAYHQDNTPTPPCAAPWQEVR